MADKKLACVVTMVKDDYAFLERWVGYYGAIFGRDALYVVNHGGDARVAEIAAGCSLVDLPGDFQTNFDMVRWRLFNGLQQGLRGYYNFVIITDVDEFVVVDPKSGLGLDEFLAKRRGKVTVTPIGVEVVHQPALEPEPIGAGPMLGPRRYARFTTAYSKPIIFNHEVKLARGGHYSTDPELKVFRNLYLFHMRFADEALYRDTLARRSAQVAEIPAGGEDSNVSWHWKREGKTTTPFDRLIGLPIRSNFDFDKVVERMHATWEPRDAESGFYHFERDIGKSLKTVPERFFGLI